MPVTMPWALPEYWRLATSMKRLYFLSYTLSSTKRNASGESCNNGCTNARN